MNATTTRYWTRTSIQNLVRHKKSGRYYARLYADGKETWKALKTDLLEVAKAKLRELTDKAERMVRASTAQERGRMTVGDCGVALEKRLEQGYGLKGKGTRLRKIAAGTQKYRRETIAALWRSWPELKESDVRKVSARAIEDWAERFGKEYSATRYNATLDTLRMLFRIAQDADARIDNPTERIGRMTVKQKSLQLPERGQFQVFVRNVREAGGRFSKACADFIEFLAFTGARKKEAKHVVWADVDFARGRLHLRITKGGQARFVPLIGDAVSLLQRLQAERLDTADDAPVLKVNESQKSMDAAAKKAGIARITHHDLRHLFATTCIEAGVDIPTVSRWMGHRDGGTLAMRTYGHLRDEHSAAAAKKVSFAAFTAAAEQSSAATTAA